MKRSMIPSSTVRHTEVVPTRHTADSGCITTSRRTADSSTLEIGVVSPSSPRNLGRTLFSRVAYAKSSLHLSLVYFRQPKLEAVEEDLLVVSRF